MALTIECVYRYYKGELNRVDTTGEHPPNLHIRSMNGQPAHEQMNHINLNAVSAQALADWLWERFDAQGGCVNGCAGLNPEAYRECVEALKLSLLREDIADCELGEEIRAAIAKATEAK